MANVFISYSRQTESMVRALATDIDALGHTVWFDQELSGGQAWWDQVLENIRDCDIFLFALATSTLKSIACKRECDYAERLGKPIVPVLVDDEISANLLPPNLSQIQFVDHRALDRDAAIRLAKALANTRPPQPNPSPLPAPPEVPVSYLGSLTERVETTSTLSFEDQSALIVDLKGAFRDDETNADARILLETLRRRRDLLATIAEEIDEVLAEEPARATVHARRTPTAEESETTPEEDPARSPGSNGARDGDKDVPRYRTVRRRRWFSALILAVASLGVAASVANAVFMETRDQELAAAAMAATLIGGVILAARIWRGRDKRLPIANVHRSNPVSDLFGRIAGTNRH